MKKGSLKQMGITCFIVALAIPALSISLGSLAEAQSVQDSGKVCLAALSDSSSKFKA